jgi:hypothetical protein
MSMPISDAQEADSSMGVEGRSRRIADAATRVAPRPSGLSPRVRRLPCALTIALIIAVASAPAFADYRDAFARGIRAQRNSRWPEVAAAMRDAIREQPNDSGESIVISGFGDRTPYTPNFWLGFALYYLNDCRNSLEAFRNSESTGGWQRVSNSHRERATRFRQECEAKLAPEKPPTTVRPESPKTDSPPRPDLGAINAAIESAEAAVSRAQQAQNTVGALANDENLARVWRSESGLGAEEQRAKDNLTKGRAELDAGRKESNLQRLHEAAALASRATQGFEAVGTTARTRRDELRAAVNTLPAPAEPKLPGVKAPEMPTPAAFVPPAPLRAAADLFFKARYQEAATRLGALKYDTGPAAGHAALLRAAAQYSLYLLGGERDQSLLMQARQAVADTRRYTPNLRPDRSAFSPRFVQFFANESRRP